MKAAITGIGGIFFQSKDPKALMQWYEKHLGLSMTAYGHTFAIHAPENNPHYLQWSVMKENAAYFEPSKSGLMINYRVNDLIGFLELLQKDGIEPLEAVQEFDYGKFAHILDCDGNKIELWEPIDRALDEEHSKQENKDA